MSLRKVLAAACLGASLCGGANAALVDWSGRASTAVGTDLREEQVAFERGVEALLRQDYALAEKHFNKSREINPKWVEPYLGLADVELARKHGDKARALLTRALELKPDSAVAWSGMGRLEFNEGRYTEAERAFKKALELDPYNWRAQIDLADLSLTHLGRPEQAAEAYRSAIRLQQRHGGARYGLGASLMALGDYKAASDAFAEAERLSPGNTLARIGLAQAKLGAGEPLEAAAIFDELLTKLPHLYPAALGKADALLARGKYQEAVAAYRQALPLTRDPSPIWLQIGKIEQGQGHTREATSAYQSAIETQPKSVQAYNNLAWMHAERKQRLDESLGWAKKATEIAPGSAAVFDTLGYVHLQRGESREAIAALSKASKLAPADATIKLRLARALGDGGQRSEALSIVEQILKADPSNTEGVRLRKQLEAASPSS